MAVKNHLLDGKIIKAAKEEFMEYGFHKASLNRIVKKAGVTSGALYTRYKNKDEIFNGIINFPIEDINRQMGKVYELYNKSQLTKKVEDFLMAVEYEEKIYLDILFKHYDDCVLLICKSEGSEIYNKLKELIDIKSKETAQFFKQGNSNIDIDGIQLILMNQINFFSQILEKGYDKQKAISVMKTYDYYLLAGWKALFEKVFYVNSDK